ncbi:hypothetical protein Y032_0082g1541 [Ancylostoma ceylanicum]|uniref:Endonuclease/exonuclease/phosphatase domain-containing protein n=1 Tax=Ancylostoma ceylanicum TaxID=53326 RepID=A0A016TRJ3_9BILA|nr:hypothetical protein Y032_0082g1541 [Ancylostoma ceylanicum]
MPGIDWNSDDSSNSLSFRDVIRCHGFTQYISSTTRDSSTLDLLFANFTELIDNVLLHAPVGTSDHSSITFNILGGRVDFHPIYRRSFAKCDYEAINTYLASVNWINSFESFSSVNDKYNISSRSHLRLWQHAFANRVASLLNKLPPVLRISQDSSMLKRTLTRLDLLSLLGIDDVE